MATLRAHGAHILIDYLWYRLAYCQDGEILKNDGGGWRRCKVLRAGIAYQTAAANAVNRREAAYEARPCMRKLRTLVDELCPSYARRMYLRMGLELLGDDPDGLYSEFRDGIGRDRPDLDFSDVNELCTWYALAVTEGRGEGGA